MGHTIAYTEDERIGSDGDWVEDPAVLDDYVASMWDHEDFEDGEIEELAKTYVVVDLSDLKSLSAEEFGNLFHAWKLARNNGWTNSESDRLIKDWLFVSYEMQFNVNLTSVRNFQAYEKEMR